MTLTLYSQYFNPKVSKRLGRRISLKSAKNFSNAKLEEILKSMSLKYEVREAVYPRVPWEKCNLYVIEAKVKKSTLIELIERKLA